MILHQSQGSILQKLNELHISADRNFCKLAYIWIYIYWLSRPFIIQPISSKHWKNTVYRSPVRVKYGAPFSLKKLYVFHIFLVILNAILCYIIPCHHETQLYVPINISHCLKWKSFNIISINFEHINIYETTMAQIVLQSLHWSQGTLRHNVGILW